MAPKKRSQDRHKDPIAQEVDALLEGDGFSLPKEEGEETEDDTTHSQIEPSLVKDVLGDMDFTTPQAEPVPPKTASLVDDFVAGMSFDKSVEAPEVAQQEEEKVALQDEEIVEEPSPIRWEFDQAEDGDTEGEDVEPVIDLLDDEYEPKEDDTQPHEFAEELKPSVDEPLQPTKTDRSPDISADAEKRRQALINRLTKKFGPDVIDEIQKASEVLTEKSMQNLLLQYWAEDQEFKAEDEISKAQERLNKKSWKQKIAESPSINTIIGSFPIVSPILGAGLGIIGSVAARSGANILIKKALMNRVHHGLGEATAFITGGTFGAVKGYLHERERRRDARQLLQDIEDGHLLTNSVSLLQIINESLRDGLKGEQETMERIFAWQSSLRFLAINEHQLSELAEHGLEQVEQGKAANEVILDNLSELFDRKANLEFKESKKKFKRIYGRGWEQMAKKMGKGALAGGITSLLAYEVAHWVADKIGDIWAAHHGGSTTSPTAPAPEPAPSASHPTAPEVLPDHPVAEAPVTSPATEPTLPNQSAAEAPLIPESPHHITNPTDYARELTVKDPTFQDMVHKFADGQVSGENGADSILIDHGVLADYQIQESNDATLSDRLKELIQANQDKLNDPETAQVVYNAVYNAASHPILLIDYQAGLQTGHLSVENLASDWHHLSQSFSGAHGEMVNDIDKFIASQHQLWNGDHLPKDIAEEFTKTQHIVDAASFSITAPDAASSVTSATPSFSSSSLSSSLSPSSPSSPSSTPSSPVSFWQSPTGNGLKALGMMSAGVGVAGAIAYGLDKRDANKKQAGQSESPDDPSAKKAEEKKKPNTKESEKKVSKGELVENQPERINDFVRFVQEDLQNRPNIMSWNSLIMTLSVDKQSSSINLSLVALKSAVGNMGLGGFDSVDPITFSILSPEKIWNARGEMTVFRVGDKNSPIAVHDPNRPNTKPDLSKPGHFEFYYIK